MRIGSLFSGIGGIELGFERAGYTTAWFVENNEYARAVLRRHWPDATIYGDITQIDFTAVPKVDIITGGFPCQDISNAGRRDGITGSRSSLWKHYLRAIRDIRPEYAVIENVAALCNRGLDTVLCDLATIGYDAEWHVISAAAVGAFHRRERVFIIAYPGTADMAHPVSIGDGSESGPSGGGREDTEDAGPEPAHAGDDVPLTMRRGPERVQCEESVPEKDADVADSDSGMCGRRRTIGQSRDEQEWRIPIKETEQTRSVIRSEIIGCGPICGEKSDDVPDTHSIGCETSGPGSRSQEGDVERSGPRQELDIITGTGCWATEPDVVRVAHGIPRRLDRIRCLGNAVVPQCAEAIARAIKEHDTK